MRLFSFSVKTPLLLWVAGLLWLSYIKVLLQNRMRGTGSLQPVSAPTGLALPHHSSVKAELTPLQVLTFSLAFSSWGHPENKRKSMDDSTDMGEICYLVVTSTLAGSKRAKMPGLSNCHGPNQQSWDSRASLSWQGRGKKRQAAHVKALGPEDRNHRNSRAAHPGQISPLLLPEGCVTGRYGFIVLMLMA
ncbi:hypothetical protein AV530_015658 [Patagioenas fasciata monilis]|uniref:Uncharacterized protein n=1 Tax=Patagioenas fasciata monilis TaxID=372326 RepID=A0A1V4KID1_PATFA|nr:hypothetical protein AV530_015658 [Patagioenas fasciata monilis]